MNKYLTFDQDDKKLWMGIGAVGVIFVLMFSIFTTTSFFRYVEMYVFALIVIFLPGYTIVKLYLDKFTISDNRIADKFMVSFGLSIMTMVLPYFLTTYLRPYVFNTDETGMQSLSNTALTVILLILVIGGAFGYKYYLLKKQETSGSSEQAGHE